MLVEVDCLWCLLCVLCGASECCISAGNGIEESWCSQTEKYELSTQIELLLRKRKTDYKLERNFLFELVGIIFYFTIN